MARMVALALAVVAATGCGDPGIDPDTAREVVEHAIGIPLREVDPPVEEVKKAYMATDKQHFVQLYVLESADDAAQVKDAVPKTAQGGAVRSAVHRNVFVVYASLAGASRADEVIRAVEGLK